MALFLFTRAILAGEPIRCSDHGKMVRDFTYIDDIAERRGARARPPATADPTFNADSPIRQAATRTLSRLQHRQQRSGAADGVHRGDRVRARQDRHEEFLPLQDGDVPATSADVNRSSRPGPTSARPCRCATASAASSSGTATISRALGAQKRKREHDHHRSHRPGYVGLPLAVEFGKKYRTLGFDLAAEGRPMARHVDPTGEVAAPT